ncbi:MAG: NAD(+) synthase [Clostridia bacterium]|nr:NAD(+) synthase [Clostridia bacterium]
MNNGFIKVKCVSPEIKLGSPEFNASLVADEILKAEAQGIKILVFPELCLSGATLGDLLKNELMLKGCEDGIRQIMKKTGGVDTLAFVGVPVGYHGEVYSCVAVLQAGNLLGLVVKSSVAIDDVLGQEKIFSPIENYFPIDEYAGVPSPVNGSHLIFTCENVKDLVVGCEIGIDSQNASILTRAGATIIVNPCACYETVANEEYRLMLARVKSKRHICGYIMCNPGESESTSSAIFSAHNIICENGDVLAENKPFSTKTGDLVSEIDVNYIANKQRNGGLVGKGLAGTLGGNFFQLRVEDTALTRRVLPYPFLLESQEEMAKRCEKIYTMESHAIARRLKSSYSKCAVIGISGGLDSTLALITLTKATDYLGWDRKSIVAITMPCFGTTNRTKSNAVLLCEAFGVTTKEINISEAVRVHLSDIGESLESRTVTFENAQARERTQVLMDVANQLGGIVIGTGDMSEVALGWATYNGDHMSMYNVNSAIVKTLVRALVAAYAKDADEATSKILYDILDTPVSPELLPGKDGKIQQKTEDLVGPYDLHDFFIYNFVGRGFTPSKVYRLATIAFEGMFDKETIYKWLEVFIKRFFTQHFKRSCSPDGIKLGSVSLSKTDLNMPSDMSYELYLNDLKSVKK